MASRPKSSLLMLVPAQTREEDVHARQYYGEVGAHQTSLQPLCPLPAPLSAAHHAATFASCFLSLLFAGVLKLNMGLDRQAPRWLLAGFASCTRWYADPCHSGV